MQDRQKLKIINEIKDNLFNLKNMEKDIDHIHIKKIMKRRNQNYNSDKVLSRRKS